MSNARRETGHESTFRQSTSAAPAKKAPSPSNEKVPYVPFSQRRETKHVDGHRSTVGPESSGAKNATRNPSPSSPGVHSTKRNSLAHSQRHSTASSRRDTVAFADNVKDGPRSGRADSLAPDRSRGIFV